MDTSKFWVIAVISNPVQYASRYRLFEEFRERMKDVNLLIVEQAFGDRPFVVTETHNVRHVQVRSFEELWHKENMINIGIQYLSQLDPAWEYVAWVDGDVAPCGQSVKHWIEKTQHALQHHHFVQMFQTSVDLGPDGEAIGTRSSFCYNYLHDKVERTYGQPGYEFAFIGHPGYAWAARREALDLVGGLFDEAILGSGDYLMAMALIGRASDALRRDYSEDYKSKLLLWQERARQHIRRDIGYVKGNIVHYWHGKKRDRRYSDREKILVDLEFQPSIDLKRDTFGLHQLEPDRVELRDAIRRYFRSRHEDSIDLE